ncbi:hypothetical protein [Desulfospira joergensenii]|uniref:hypothetical protein n=1 Tax=Desulfospira joergensenii TaxID=53329 RepID=UPI0003B51C6A|nr:hypothetical protein [Desulfospira joergensenii]
MKDRAVRRHHERRIQKKLVKDYDNCIQDLPADEQRELEGKVEKLKKVCASPYSEESDRRLGKKTIQERKHDITMKEELR